MCRLLHELKLLSSVCENVHIMTSYREYPLIKRRKLQCLDCAVALMKSSIRTKGGGVYQNENLVCSATGRHILIGISFGIRQSRSHHFKMEKCFNLCGLIDTLNYETLLKQLPINKIYQSLESFISQAVTLHDKLKI